jgi:hypothetical protein
MGEVDMNQRTKAILIGVAVGSLLGAAMAWVATDGYDDASSNENPLAALRPSDYAQLGIAILALARQFGGMLKRA